MGAVNSSSSQPPPDLADRARQVAADLCRSIEVTGLHAVCEQIDELAWVEAHPPAECSRRVLEKHGLAAAPGAADNYEAVVKWAGGDVR